MLEKFDFLSVNQTAAQIKLTEAWKASRDDQYPIKMRKERPEGEESSTRSTRPVMRREMDEGGRTKIAQDSLTRDFCTSLFG